MKPQARSRSLGCQIPSYLFPGNTGTWSKFSRKIVKLQWPEDTYSQTSFFDSSRVKPWRGARLWSLPLKKLESLGAGQKQGWEWKTSQSICEWIVSYNTLFRLALKDDKSFLDFGATENSRFSKQKSFFYSCVTFQSKHTVFSKPKIWKVTQDYLVKKILRYTAFSLEGGISLTIFALASAFSCQWLRCKLHTNANKCHFCCPCSWQGM